MRKSLSLAALMAAVLLLPGLARSAEPAYVGTWKVLYLQPGTELALCIVKVEAGPKIEVVAPGHQLFKNAKVEGVKADGAALKFTIRTAGPTFDFAAYPPKKEKEPKTILGWTSIAGNRSFVRFERTEDTTIDPKAVQKQTGGMREYFQAAFGTRDPKAKEKALKELLEKHPNTPIAYQSALSLLEVMPVNGAKEEVIKSTAEKAIEIAGAYGPEMKEGAVAGVAQKLVASRKAPALAVEYARRAEKHLPKDATAATQAPVLKTLLSALKQADRKDEVKSVEERVARLEKQLDVEYLKDAVPFKTTKFTRKGNSARTVLVELFTGAQCPPCVAADVAFDAALKTFGPRDVVLIQYHLHVPGPDALTNDDTETREKYYKVRGVPSTFVNGGSNLGLGGGKANGQASFGRLSDAVQNGLEKDSAVKIKLTAEQSGNTIDIKAEVSDLKDAADGKMKLRLALCEETVRYPGGNGQRFHHHVVRAMPGGVAGIALKEAKETQEVKVDLAVLKKTLADTMEQANKRRPFRETDRPLDLKHLLVVAFIQNDDTKEVVQAAQVKVHAKK